MRSTYHSHYFKYNFFFFIQKCWSFIDFNSCLLAYCAVYFCWFFYFILIIICNICVHLITIVRDAATKLDMNEIRANIKCHKLDLPHNSINNIPFEARFFYILEKRCESFVLMRQKVSKCVCVYMCVSNS